MKQESTDRQVDLHEDSPWMIARLIQFFHVGSFDFNPIKREGHNFSTVKNVLVQANKSSLPLPPSRHFKSRYDIALPMYAIADKYDVPRLQAMTASTLLNELRKDTNRVNTFIQRFTDVHAMLSRNFTEFGEVHTQLGQLLLSFVKGYTREENRSLYVEIDKIMQSDAYIACMIAQSMQDTLEQEKKTLEKANSILEATNGKLQTERDNLEAELANSKKEPLELRQELEKAQGTIQKLVGKGWKRLNWDARTINSLMERLEAAEEKIRTHKCT